MAHTTSGPKIHAASGPEIGLSHSHSDFWWLTLGSVGVVYGDIGTSPLYALREAVTAAVGEGGEVTELTVLGVLSLIFWALIIVVTLKYIAILLRADNHGEGGTLSLTALAFRALGRRAVQPGLPFRKIKSRVERRVRLVRASAVTRIVRTRVRD